MNIVEFISMLNFCPSFAEAPFIAKGLPARASPPCPAELFFFVLRIIAAIDIFHRRYRLLYVRY